MAEKAPQLHCDSTAGGPSFHGLGRGAGFDSHNTNPIDCSLNNSHSWALSSFTDGEAWSISSNAPEGQGLEAYRRLCFRFDPTTAGRRRNIVSSLLNPEKVKLDDLASAIETWEEKVRAYEARRGPDGERKR